jgi:hypothetical protein
MERKATASYDLLKELDIPPKVQLVPFLEEHVAAVAGFGEGRPGVALVESALEGVLLLDKKGVENRFHRVKKIETMGLWNTVQLCQQEFFGLGFSQLLGPPVWFVLRKGGENNLLPVAINAVQEVLERRAGDGAFAIATDESAEFVEQYEDAGKVLFWAAVGLDKPVEYGSQTHVGFPIGNDTVEVVNRLATDMVDTLVMRPDAFEERGVVKVLFLQVFIQALDVIFSKVAKKLFCLGEPEGKADVLLAQGCGQAGFDLREECLLKVHELGAVQAEDQVPVALGFEVAERGGFRAGAAVSLLDGGEQASYLL